MKWVDVIQVADHGRDEHGPDVGGKSEVERLEALAQPGADPHGDEEDDDRFLSRT